MLFQPLFRDETEQKIAQQAAQRVEDHIVHIHAAAQKQLQKLDEVAYVRFASVHKRFSDINTFMEALKELLEDK